MKTCMIQDYPNFEIIVSDDCSDDNSVEVVHKLINQDSRIKLFAHEKHLGMRENFEFALNKVRPGYVMALGGDDGLVPGCIWRMFEILSSTKKELLTWTPAGFSYSNREGGQNIFYFKRKKNTGVKLLSSEVFLTNIAKTFLYQIDECPMFYMKGVASTTLIDRVKSRTKDHSFYYCPTPDGFSGIVLAGEVEDYAFTYEPLSIGGDTIKSQGKNYGRTDRASRKEAKQFFKDNSRRLMHADLASQQYSPLITLMTADFLLTAQDLPGWPGKFPPISFESLLRAS
ncbi:MAG: glycosyltransferase family A protein, partial [Ferruginibacter sp.]